VAGRQIAARSGTAEQGISATTLFVLCVTAANAVAGLYYIQPLLSLVARDFGTSLGVTGLLVTATQVGYVLGLALVVPLGDLLEQRKILAMLLVAAALALTGAGCAPTFWPLCAMLVSVGITAAAAQVAVPLAANLALPERRGRATGTVMSGLLLGILLARTVSGVLTELISWRAVFLLAAVVQLILAGLVWQEVPRTVASTDSSYRGLLVSVLRLIGSSPLLRARMFFGLLSMCGFSAMWTSIAFLLAGDGGTRYHFGEAVIGVFGLAGVAGALGAPVVGRLADGGRVRLAATGAWMLVILGWCLSAGGTVSVVALIVGLVMFDLGVQSIQLSNQHAIYTAHPEARSRVTTAYMMSYFFGGILGSVVSGFAYGAGGWLAVCGFGLGVAMLGLLAWKVVASAEFRGDVCDDGLKSRSALPESPNFRSATGPTSVCS
jgi:predicted MFS family arabinose efflux permease